MSVDNMTPFSTHAPSPHLSDQTLSATAPFAMPWRYLIRMVVFLGLIGFLIYILQKPILDAFMANPGLNGLMGGVLLIGTLLAFIHVLRLTRDVRWARGVQLAPDFNRPLRLKAPFLLAPTAALLKEDQGRAPLSPTMLRSLLDSLATRLDESREMTRYLAGLLIFLGLLGTFWGLLETVGAIGKVIGTMRSGGDPSTLFDELKAGLATPLAGMGLSFSSSLFGLAGSLVLGFLDLQAGQAQRRFYTQVEDWLSPRVREENAVSSVQDGGRDHFTRLEQVLSYNLQALQTQVKAATTEPTGTSRAIVHLAEAVGGLVQQMRHEQQLIRDWVEAQAVREQAMTQEVRTLVNTLLSASITDDASRGQSMNDQKCEMPEHALPQDVRDPSPRGSEQDFFLPDDHLSHLEALMSGTESSISVDEKASQNAHQAVITEQAFEVRAHDEALKACSPKSQKVRP
jgi:hypothetical protein